MTLMSDIGHGIDRGFSQSNFETALCQKWDGQLTLDKGYELIIHGHEQDLLDSDRDDFRRALDLFNCIYDNGLVQWQNEVSKCWKDIVKAQHQSTVICIFLMFSHIVGLDRCVIKSVNGETKMMD